MEELERLERLEVPEDDADEVLTLGIEDLWDTTSGETGLVGRSPYLHNEGVPMGSGGICGSAGGYKDNY